MESYKMLNQLKPEKAKINKDKREKKETKNKCKK